MSAKMGKKVRTGRTGSKGHSLSELATGESTAHQSMAPLLRIGMFRRFSVEDGVLPANALYIPSVADIQAESATHNSREPLKPSSQKLSRSAFPKTQTQPIPILSSFQHPRLLPPPAPSVPVTRVFVIPDAVPRGVAVVPILFILLLHRFPFDSPPFAPCFYPVERARLGLLLAAVNADAAKSSGEVEEQGQELIEVDAGSFANKELLEKARPGPGAQFPALADEIGRV